MNKKELLSWVLSALLLVSCGTDKTESASSVQASQYILAISIPSRGLYPFHLVSDLESGTVDVNASQVIPDIPNNVLVTTKPGFIFLNSKEKLTKYSVDSKGTLTAAGSVANTGLLGGPISVFLDEERLFISTSPRQVQDSLFVYQIINTKDMTEEKRGEIHLQVKPGTMASPSMYILKEGKVLVPYIQADAQNHAYGRAHIAIFNANDMAFEKTISTDKTACLGYSIVSSHAFTENGDLYITSSNSNYWGANESLPSGIVRIRAGHDTFDDTYFLNLSTRLNGNHTGGIVYAGHNKVIMQVFDSSLIKAYRDYQNGFVIRYYEVDLLTQLVRKLDIPLSKYPRRAMERLPNGKVAIAINAENGENAFYIYDGKTKLVKKGLVYSNAEYLSGWMAF